jgi:hypothetical protein
MGIVRKDLSQKFETPLDQMTGPKFTRAIISPFGCEATVEHRRCGEEVTNVILFDVRPEANIDDGNPKDIPIGLCDSHKNTSEFDHMFYIEGNVVPGSIRRLPIQDYVDGKF